MEGLRKQDSTDSLDEMDEWNLVSLQNSVNGSGMDSSCEFVSVVKKNSDEHESSPDSSPSPVLENMSKKG